MNKKLAIKKEDKMAITELKLKMKTRMQAKFLICIAFFLFLVSSAYAYCPGTGNCQFGYKPYTSPSGTTCCYQDIFLNAATITVMITILLVAAVYMLGRVLENSKLIHWAEEEFTQVLGTVLIVFLFISSTYILDTLIGPAFYGSSVLFPEDTFRTSKQAAYAGWDTVHTHVENYIDSDVKGGIESFVKGFSWVGIVLAAISSFSLSIQPDPNLSLFYTPFSATFGPLQSILGMVFNVVVASAAQLQIQLAIIRLGTGIFTILLPIGVLFRAFPFTRPAGGALISIAFGFTIFLPIAYLIAEDVSLHLYGSAGRPTGDQLIGEIAGMSTSVGGPDEMQAFLDTGFAPGGTLRRMALFILVEVTLLPFLAYIMVLNLVRNLAEMFGAHIDFSALVRMI